MVERLAAQRPHVAIAIFRLHLRISSRISDRISDRISVRTCDDTPPSPAPPPSPPPAHTNRVGIAVAAAKVEGGRMERHVRLVALERVEGALEVERTGPFKTRIKR